MVAADVSSVLLTRVLTALEIKHRNTIVPGPLGIESNTN